MKAAERAYSKIRQGILRGSYRAGARLTEQDVALAAGVSRTPVREALRRLHAEGLVQFEPNHGAIVAMLEPHDAIEIFELRAVLESLSARLAAERASAESIAELRRLAEQQIAEAAENGARRIARLGELNARFHRLVQEGAASPRLAKALAGLTEAPLILRTFKQYSDAELSRSASQHLELVQAFEARDGEWAESIMRSHIRAARATYLRSTRS